MAEVNDNGEVTVEGQYVGRLEGFRFRQDETASFGRGQDRASGRDGRRWAPQFHLRADRFYNSRRTPRLDFTEQGGLMWGDLGGRANWSPAPNL